MFKFTRNYILMALVPVALIAVSSCAGGQEQSSYTDAIYKLVTEPSQVTELTSKKDGKEYKIKWDLAQTRERGGSDSGKALGFYHGEGKYNREFKSDYRKLDPKTIAKFTNALNDFINSKGGGLEKNSDFIRTNIQSEPDVVLDKIFVPYNEQTQFAKTWWQENSEDFASLDLEQQQVWIEESLLDGNSLIVSNLMRKRPPAEVVAVTGFYLGKLVDRE